MAKQKFKATQWGTFEDKSVYDGWILKARINTKGKVEIKWRDHFTVQRLSEQKKAQLEKIVTNFYIKQYDNSESGEGDSSNDKGASDKISKNDSTKA